MNDKNKADPGEIIESLLDDAIKDIKCEYGRNRNNTNSCRPLSDALYSVWLKYKNIEKKKCELSGEENDIVRW